MRHVENISLNIEIDSAGEAMSDTQKAAVDMKRILQKVIEKLDDEDPEEDGWVLALQDLNGNNVGTAYLNIEEKDWITDRDEWVKQCKETIEEVGYYDEQTDTLIKDWDLAVEADYDGISEWFKNYTDSCVTNERVCPEALEWDWE